ncbi:MAG: CehA/McbA family metallohydrolase [Dethiobacteria bacterium]
MYNYSGNIHIHSSYSDGTGTIEEIANEANRAGLDFVIITDHLTRGGAADERRYGRLMVIVGVELHKEANHLLALGAHEPIDDFTDTPQRSIDAVNQQGGFSFLAHPVETGSPLVTDGAAFPWTDWSVENYTGIELWNYCSQWKAEALSIPKILYWYLFDRDGPVKKGPPHEGIRRWDELTRERKVVAIGGTDAHAINHRLGFIKVIIFPYVDLFRTINTYVMLEEELSANFEKARGQIFDALQEGRCYISLDRYGQSRDFYFGAFNAEKKVHMGSELEFGEGTSLMIKAPGRRPLIKIIKNGKPVCEKTDNNLILKVLERGTFRVEVYHRPKWGRPRPWIYSNPIYIK